MLVLKSPINGSVVSIRTDAQKAFSEDGDLRKNMDGNLSFTWYDLKRQGVDDTIPMPVSFAFDEQGNEQTDEDAYYYLLVSESADMSAPWVYITKDRALDVYNLKVGTKYYWCVQRGGQRSDVSSFETLLTLPRCLKIDSISNVRDIGGYSVDNGRRIRQGLVYRGGEFELHMHLDPSGARELCRIGIRTELDMRAEAEGKIDKTTAECIGIKRIFVPSSPYTEVFDKNQRASLKKFFKSLADKSNYPIYFHCWGGADRTGTFAFILGAFLGMSFDDLIYEYEFTSLSIWGIRNRNYVEFDKFLKLFMELDGNTLKEKSTTFLKDYAGLTDKQLASIYEILVNK